MRHPNSNYLQSLEDEQFNINVYLLVYKNKISDFPLDKIFCDMWGPILVAYTQNFKFYVVFIDDYP